jgi:hypothetical protein
MRFSINRQFHYKFIHPAQTAVQAVHRDAFIDAVN